MVHQALKMFSVHGVSLLYSLLVICLIVCGNHALEDNISDDDSDHIQKNDDILQPPGKFTYFKIQAIRVYYNKRNNSARSVKFDKFYCVIFNDKIILVLKLFIVENPHDPQTKRFI